MTAVVIIEGLVIVLLAILVAGLLKSHAEILRQLDALGVTEEGTITLGSAQTRPKTTGFERAPATTLSGVTLDGAATTVSLEQGRGNTMLAFLSSGCLSCQTFWKELGGDFEPPTPATRAVIVTKGPESESPSRIRELAPSRVPLVMSDEVWQSFKVPMTPYFMLVDGAGMVIGEGAAASWKHLLGLLRQSAADATSIDLTNPSKKDPPDRQLKAAGVLPGDPSLYESPLDEVGQ
jgi:hypothetical protein